MDLISTIEQIPGVRIHRDARLEAFSTFKLGGPCARLVACETAESLVGVVCALRGTPFILIGGGSNILFSDQGYDGWMVRYCAPSDDIERDGSTISSEAFSRLCR